MKPDKSKTAEGLRFLDISLVSNFQRLLKGEDNNYFVASRKDVERSKMAIREAAARSAQQRSLKKRAK